MAGKPSHGYGAHEHRAGTLLLTKQLNKRMGESVESGEDDKVRKLFIDWFGGYFETHYSVNPHWVADFEKLPAHPITRGV